MHARDDGSFGRSASSQTLKGAGLIVLALFIGVVLLRTAPKTATTITTNTGPPVTSKPSPGTHGSTTTSAAGPTSTAATVHSPSQVSVLVANGSGVHGLAAQVRGQLNQAGYDTSKSAINATVSNLQTTTLYYAPGFQADAVKIGSALGLTNAGIQPISASVPVPSGSQSGVDVIVVAGADLGGSSSSNTTEAPAGNTIAPSGTVQSGGSGSGTATTVARTPTTTAARTPTTASHTTTTA